MKDTAPVKEGSPHFPSEVYWQIPRFSQISKLGDLLQLKLK